MILLNPTGGTIRNDPEGHGYFGAPRGSKTHNGLDFTLPEGPGQLILAPVSGFFVRYANPYANDTEYQGLLLANHDIAVKMFYVRPDASLEKKWVTKGQPIGTAQDITKKYGGKMLPHIHLEITMINPAVFF